MGTTRGGSRIDKHLGLERPRETLRLDNVKPPAPKAVYCVEYFVTKFGPPTYLLTGLIIMSVKTLFNQPECNNSVPAYYQYLFSKFPQRESTHAKCAAVPPRILLTFLHDTVQSRSAKLFHCRAENRVQARC